MTTNRIMKLTQSQTTYKHREEIALKQGSLSDFRIRVHATTRANLQAVSSRIKAVLDNLSKNSFIRMTLPATDLNFNYAVQLFEGNMGIEISEPDSDVNATLESLLVNKLIQEAHDQGLEHEAASISSYHNCREKHWVKGLFGQSYSVAPQYNLSPIPFSLEDTDSEISLNSSKGSVSSKRRLDGGYTSDSSQANSDNEANPDKNSRVKLSHAASETESPNSDVSDDENVILPLRRFSI